MSDDSGPVPLDLPRHRRQIFAFDPRVSTGTILEMTVLVVGGVIAYGAYTADQTKRDMKVEQVRADLESSRSGIRESIREMRDDLKDMQHTLTDVSQNVAVLKARPPMPDEPRRRQ